MLTYLIYMFSYFSWYYRKGSLRRVLSVPLLYLWILEYKIGYSVHIFNPPTKRGIHATNISIFVELLFDSEYQISAPF